MKTFVKLDAARTAVVSPSAKGVLIALKVGPVEVGTMEFTPDQAGALVFGVEQAIEAGATARERAAVAGIKP